ncbi:MAG: tRNA (N(6)-L-threonylcarbamoyladenosine(37)-C(2))-methylthiotransferase [Candidatus Bathyarchaeum sp.]|nr:MAG: tRNA (N(6)-L-threonylcarbamoyladenosine(37)-C(2))-methylthiotransferase [Candidatus Bathyarchaeum sp.]
MVEGSRRVYVKSFGCSANLADGEVIAGCLSGAGFDIVEDPQDAEILLYNTCAVKSPTENRIIGILRSAPGDKRLVVTGCLPLINFERLKNEVEFDGVTGPAPGARIVEVIRRVDGGEKVVYLGGISRPSLFLPRVPVNRLVSVVPINYGCLGECSYCCVFFARGQLKSNLIPEIVERVKQDLNSGAKEVWLTSQDTACYGKDVGTSLADLLRRVCEIEGNFFVRVGMMTPNQVMGILDELIEAYKGEKIFKFLHLPVQSGDDDVLKLMNRRYTVNEFKEIAHAFREEIPRITLSTDVICGFSGESREAFERTKNLIREIQPEIVNVSKFFSRPRTAAEKLNPLPPKEVNRRSREMAELSKQISFEKNRAWINWEGTVLFDERGKGESWMGRNFAYKPIVVRACESLLGKFVRVRVVDAFSTYLGAEVVDGS